MRENLIINSIAKLLLFTFVTNIFLHFFDKFSHVFSNYLDIHNLKRN